MDLEFDKTKTFLYMEDNGDGTCTGVISIPEAGIFEQQILTMSFGEYLVQMMAQVPEELIQELAENTVSIPDSVED